ncbi:pyruvate, phosphate dikinase [Mycolicibacterium sp. 018/SC-01/001]|nr:pyruvate, phosphate dikinase [Mycolicibacterium sp. 018/SC-01/001]
MRRLGLPVPPAFCLPAPLCAARAPLADAVTEGLEWLRRQSGPVRVSVRSSPTVSMPGMLDTVLDVDAHEVMPAVEAVLASWDAPRSVAYRRHRQLGDAAATAVIVQVMVSGVRDDASGAGVAFSRNPLTGADELFGEWRRHSRGDAVVSGTAESAPLHVLAGELPPVHAALAHAARLLERHHADMQDIEFTVESGQLWLLQTRTATRSPRAALRTALALYADGVLDVTELLNRVTPADLDALRASSRRPVERSAPRLAAGLSAAPGVATGRAVSDLDHAVDAAEREPVVLVRTTTSPADIVGMLACSAVVTEVGGPASHAAVICRDIGRPAVVGCGPGTVAALEGLLVTVDGTTGEVFAGTLDVESWLDADADADLRAYQDIAAGADRRSAGAGQQAGELETLQRLRMSGAMSRDDIHPALHDQLSAAGLVTGTTTVRLTPQGRARLWDLLTAERAGADTAALSDIYRDFWAVNADFKAVVTDWQLRDGQPNDHSDSTYDGAVIDRLDRIHGRVTGIVDRAAAQLPRLESYRVRLEEALRHLHGGDRQWFTHPLVDSYHSAWFALHEELLVAAGLTRTDEARAGRAD